MRAAIVLQHPGVNQDKERERAERFCKREGYTPMGYFDELGRGHFPGLGFLWKQVEAGEVDVVVVTNREFVSKWVVGGHKLFWLLRDHGIKVVVSTTVSARRYKGVTAWNHQSAALRPDSATRRPIEEVVAEIRVERELKQAEQEEQLRQDPIFQMKVTKAWFKALRSYLERTGG